MRRFGATRDLSGGYPITLRFEIRPLAKKDILGQSVWGFCRGRDLEEITLDLALAWIYTRDHEFVSWLDKSGYQPIPAAFAKFNAQKDKKFHPVVGTIQEAWELLKAKIATKRLEFRGVKYLPESMEKNSLSDYGYKESGPPRRIPRKWISNLVLVESSEGMVLALVDISKEPFSWRDPEMAKPQLMKHFPSVPKKEIRPPKKTRKNEFIKKAIAEKWPDGTVLQETMKIRISLIQDWVTKNITSKSGKPEKIDGRTIRRYFTELEQ